MRSMLWCSRLEEEGIKKRQRERERKKIEGSNLFLGCEKGKSCEREKKFFRPAIMWYVESFNVYKGHNKAVYILNLQLVLLARNLSKLKRFVLK